MRLEDARFLVEVVHSSIVCAWKVLPHLRYILTNCVVIITCISSYSCVL